MLTISIFRRSKNFLFTFQLTTKTNWKLIGWAGNGSFMSLWWSIKILILDARKPQNATIHIQSPIFDSRTCLLIVIDCTRIALVLITNTVQARRDHFHMEGNKYPFDFKITTIFLLIFGDNMENLKLMSSCARLYVI